MSEIIRVKTRTEEGFEMFLTPILFFFGVSSVLGSIAFLAVMVSHDPYAECKLEYPDYDYPEICQTIEGWTPPNENNQGFVRLLPTELPTD